MKLLKVFPITKGVNKDSLSYFTTANILAGSIVKVPLRKKIVPALVVSVEEAISAKAEIKDADFTVRKIDKIKTSHLLTPEFMDSAVMVANYFSTTPGSILNSVIPKSIIENADKIKVDIHDLSKIRSHEKLVIQCEDEERYATYKSLIREEFARGYSVFFCLPTIQDIKKAFEKLPKGIEQYTFVLHGQLTIKEQIELWNKATNEKHPVLIIATGSFLGIARSDIGTIIFDKENSRSYKHPTRPFIDFRIFAEKFAEKIKARLILGDLLLRTETLHRHHEAELFEVSPLKYRSLTTGEHKLIDMKERLPDTPEGKAPQFKMFNQEFLDLIKHNKENDEHMFVFVARRGLSPSTICSDCGLLVKCHTCGAPTVLHRAPTENFFLCHRCGEHRSALEKCRNCQSWRLATFGIGIEAVEAELEKIFPDLKIFKIDSDSASTHKKALETVTKFYTSPGSILLGTEMALLYLKDMVANAGVVSMDSFFSIPDFRINEKVMNIILKIRSLTANKFLLQTRNADQPIFRYALGGNLADFYRDEIKEREQLNYPPFSLPIKITLTGDKKTVLAGMEQLQKDLEPYTVDVFPAFIPKTPGKFSMHALIKISRNTWIDEVLLNKLKALSPAYIINVDPDNLL